MRVPVWVRRDLASLRRQREAFDETAGDSKDNAAMHARTMSALCRLISAVLLDHGDEGGPQLALAAAWVDAVPRIDHDLRSSGCMTNDTAATFQAAVEAQMQSFTEAATLPGAAVVLLGSNRPRPNRLGPFEDLALRLRHKGAIDALQQYLPEFTPRSPLVDAAMDRAVEAAWRTGLDGLPDGTDRKARTAVLESAADAVEGLAMARPWLERVEDPVLHPGAAILFVRVERRLRAARALAALDALRVGPLSTESMVSLRNLVGSLIDEGNVRRAIEVLNAHGPALETALALVQADNLTLNRVGRSIAAQVGRSLPRAETVALLDRLRRVGALANDPLAVDLVARLARDGDVPEADILAIEALRMHTPIELHRVPSAAQAQQALSRRVAGG